MITRARSWLVLVVLLASCVSFDVYRVETIDTLYFGTEKPDHTYVSNDEWRTFVHDVVEPRLTGYTSWDTAGAWKDDSGRIVHEPGHVLQIVHTGASDAAIHEIIDAYKKRFAQQSVMRVHAHAGVAFQ